MDFSRTITEWYQRYKRALPWRETSDPYRIWLSEIIMQQTRVVQGLPYYLRFVDVFPTVADLAAADEDHVMRLWQGLGYYSRARNMHATARQVWYERGGVFPSTYAELIELKGIGEYTASAIASFAGNEPKAVVDGNVYRLLARYFGVDISIDTTAGKKYFASLAQEQLNRDEPGMHNQAIMEFGAMQCRPRRPLCEDCPLRSGCVALRSGLIETLPTRSKKTQVRNRYFNYLIIRDKDLLLLNKRGAGDIWQSLYDFPLVETLAPIEGPDLFLLDDFRKILKGRGFLVSSVSETVKHVLSHQVIHARFWQLTLNDCRSDNTGVRTDDRYCPPENGYLAVKENELKGYAFPKLIVNYLENKRKL